MANNGKSTMLKFENFVENYFCDEGDKLIKKQAVSQQMIKIDYIIFKDINMNFI